MKKYIGAIIFLLLFALSAKAQVFIFNEDMFARRMGTIKVKVIDSLTNEPISYASVYIVPAKDTTITNFILSDTAGVATLKEVPFGNYVFHIEMMGYKHYSKERYFKEDQMDLGTIKLKLDENYLSAITVSEVGNPIVMKQDTIEFNASSFRVGTNAMLRDLIKRMPGMEITEEGKVKFNGELIDKLTVGGRTFFFNDQSIALNNLPAAVVDKIRVIDRESEQTRNTGIQDGNREKILDVGLKKEYEDGWFGNVNLKGGTTIDGKKGDEPLRDNRGALYSAYALTAAYNKKDQVTVIANGMNVSDSGEITFVVSGDGDADLTVAATQGLSSAAQLGVNVNTSRIKDVETTVSGNYKYTDTESGSRRLRTTYQEGGNLLFSSENSGRSFGNGATATLEMRKEKGKVWFSFVPRFSFGKTDSYSNSSSETSREETLINQSESHSRNHSLSRTGNLSTGFSIRDLGGKTGRIFHFNINLNISNNDGRSNEQTILKTSTGEEDRTMRYESNSSSYNLLSLMRFTEPVSDKVTLAALATVRYSESESTRDAFDAGGFNAYYSVENKTHYINQKYDATLQYKFGKQNYITFGVTANGTLNRLISQSFNVKDTTGKGKWKWYVAPTLQALISDGTNRIQFTVSGHTNKPSSSLMVPALNISNPSHLKLGNIYLKPYSSAMMNIYWTRNNKQKFTNLMVLLTGTVKNKAISNALWYDPDGILYYIPVNSKNPELVAQLSANYTTPLGPQKIWWLSLHAGTSYSFSSSFQSTGILTALDREAFDYTEFMADFWGDSKGNRFYGGMSGFRKSQTKVFTPNGGFNIVYKQNQLTLSASASANGRISRYSLDKRANSNTLTTRIGLEGTYTTKHEFEFTSEIDYVHYKGYANGYGKPEWQWNAQISKNIGAFNLSVKMIDILNQTRSLSHTEAANYVEDSYRLVMGRYILFGIKWNFGKMNAVNSRRAQKAAFSIF